MSRTINVGTRQSPLAMWQTNFVVETLKRKCPEYDFEIIPIKTKGDKILDVALAKIGDKGLFTKEIELAMLENQIDFAVHSMKDLPTVITDGLMIAAMTQRHDSRDVLISKGNLKLEELPIGAKVGTSSLRRRSQLLHKRPDLNLQDLRGNLNTRLKKMETENFDAIVLAAAGVERLGFEEKITEKLDYSICLPAVGQGSIGIEVRADDEEIINIVRAANDLNTEWCILAERSLLKRLEGGCQIPIGARARIDEEEIILDAIVASLNGETVLRDRISGKIENAEKLGVKSAENLLAQGANKILNEIRQEIDI